MKQIYESLKTNETFQSRLDKIGCTDIDDDFIDCISLMVMDDPVTLEKTGQTYSKQALLDYFDNKNIHKIPCPKTKIEITRTEVAHASINYAFKSQIEKFVTREEKKAKNINTELKHIDKVINSSGASSSDNNISSQGPNDPLDSLITNLSKLEQDIIELKKESTTVGVTSRYTLSIFEKILVFHEQLEQLDCCVNYNPRRTGSSFLHQFKKKMKDYESDVQSALCHIMITLPSRIKTYTTIDEFKPTYETILEASALYFRTPESLRNSYGCDEYIEFLHAFNEQVKKLNNHNLTILPEIPIQQSTSSTSFKR